MPSTPPDPPNPQMAHRRLRRCASCVDLLAVTLCLAFAIGLAGCPPEPVPASPGASDAGGERVARDRDGATGLALSDEGIQPEVIAYIDGRFAEDAEAQAAARQLARALEQQVDVDDGLSAQAVAHDIATAVACLEGAGLSGTDVRVQIESRTFGTEARAEAEQRFSRLLSGRVIMLPTDPQCDHEGRREGAR